EMDRVVLIEVEVDPLVRRHMDHDAVAVGQALGQPARLEPTEALAVVRRLVALEGRGQADALGAQADDQGVRRGEAVARTAARRAPGAASPGSPAPCRRP